MSIFGQRLQELSDKKKNILCVGLDPALPRQRCTNVVPARYFKNADDNEGRLDFCLELIRQTGAFAVAIKANEQYLRGLTAQQHRKLTDVAHEHKLLAIYDCKLGDIGDSAESALFHYHEWGYDGITFNPFPGNLQEVVQMAHAFKPPIGIFVLTLMSNPQAERYMRHAILGGKSVFRAIAEEVKEYGADGCVVGATGHITAEDIKLIRLSAGNDKILLVPGVGAQKGDPGKVMVAAGRNILINVGRDIIYSENPANKALEYSTMFRALAGL